METTLDAIPLVNYGNLFTLYLTLYNRSREDEWDIVNIECYADEARTILLADDIVPEQFDAATQREIYQALDDHHAQSRALKRVLANISTPVGV